MSFELDKLNTLHVERGKVAETSTVRLQSARLLNSSYKTSHVHSWLCKCAMSSNMLTSKTSYWQSTMLGKCRNIQLVCFARLVLVFGG